MFAYSDVFFLSVDMRHGIINKVRLKTNVIALEWKHQTKANFMYTSELVELVWAHK